MSRFQANSSILKVSSELGLIFGFAAICKVDGQDYWDTDGEHYPEDAMLADSTEFAKSSRVACLMHERDEDGNPVPSGGVIHTFPLTSEIAQALDITTKRTGLLIAYAPDDPAVLEKARAGAYQGFSIGGSVIEAEYEE